MPAMMRKNINRRIALVSIRFRYSEPISRSVSTNLETSFSKHGQIVIEGRGECLVKLSIVCGAWKEPRRGTPAGDQRMQGGPCCSLTAVRLAATAVQRFVAVRDPARQKLQPLTTTRKGAWR